MANYKVAILVETSNAFSRGCIQGISQYIEEHGPWAIYYEERSLDSPVPAWLPGWDGDGVIVRSMKSDTLQCALKTRAKVVNMGIDHIPGIPEVFQDFHRNTEWIVKHFRERFYTNYAYVGIQGKYYSDCGKEAFCELLHEYPVALLDLEQEHLPHYGFGTNTQLDEWLQTLSRPCAIMACYDLVGVYVIQACRRIGILVPDEIAIAGLNDDDIQCRFSPVPLTSVHPDSVRCGYEGTKLLHQLMQGEKTSETSLRIPSLYLVSRRSTDSCVVGDKIIQEAFKIIHRDACQGLTISHIAKELGVHRRTLERNFRKIFNRSIHDEIIRVQLNKAVHLLENTDLPIAVIARRVGFANGPYLNTLYRKYFHTTPRRKKHT
ncbi:MAG: DNA-binding transcriptional regulator [Planctomycetia bacterium]|nr:DNA-binding transcriptional regulator [Planctomycetia bacterium]